MKDYSFKNTALFVNGVEITGFDEGDDVISLTRDNDSTAHKVGTDGEMTVSISADRTGSVVFRLMQSADSNSYMSALINAQENGAFVPIFVQFKDTKGADLGSGTSGYISKPADIVRGKNANAQEWTIKVERLDLLHLGGLG